MKKTWKQLFGNKKVVIKCGNKIEWEDVNDYFDIGFPSRIFSDHYNCLELEGYCYEEFYKVNKFEIVTYQEFYNMIRNNEEYTKPPLGVIPRKYWIQHRKQELARAINEYINSNTPCNNLKLWVEELNQLIKDENNEL